MTVAVVSAATNVDADTGSYFERAARAALDCLVAAEVAIDDVGLLINVGIHRDSNIVEPAAAALIQQRIGLGLEYGKSGHPFSFDLMHGACGLLYAVGVAESFFATGDLEHVLIVAGEAHPSTKTAPDFPYTGSGAALLLGRSEGGFGSLHASASGIDRLSSYVPLLEVGAAGRNSMHVRPPMDPLDLAVNTVRRCAEAEQLEMADVLVLAPSPTPDFGDRLALKLGIERQAVATADVGDTHSAATIFAFAAATDVLAQRSEAPVLWLVAGGPSAACMAYRRAI